jgi:DNA-binding response OmpR family regulator
VIVAVHPPAVAGEVEDGLALAGAAVTPVPDLDPEAKAIGEADVLLVDLDDQPLRRLRDLGRVAEVLGIPVLVIADATHLALMESAGGVTDFLVRPVDPVELRLRLTRMTVTQDSAELVVFKDLELNPLTYQATLAGDPLDLTFMEYELLRFLASNPVRVWSREQLLSKVWGYDYYGGARTVDVHVRRLRSKLGEERASWITTVRSVGYRFG